MNTKDEALKLTLERINLHLAHHEHGCVYLDDALVAVIRKALAEQPAQQQDDLDSILKEQLDNSRLKRIVAEQTASLDLATLKRQKKALKRALNALEYVIARNYGFAATANPVGNSITEIRKVLGETK